MVLTKREIWMLHQLLDFDIARYLMANSCQRLDGGEKADRHIAMSKNLCRFIFAEGDETMGDTTAILDSWKAVHDYLANILTDRMDEVIGFPIDKAIYGSGYDLFREKFFWVIINHFDEIEEIARDAVSAENCE